MEHLPSGFCREQERRGKAAASVCRVGPGSVKADMRLREELVVDIVLPAEDFLGLEAGVDRSGSEGGGPHEGATNGGSSFRFLSCLSRGEGLSILRVTQEV